MSSADELFLNGKIRPMKLSSHLQRPQHLAPLLDLDEEEEEVGSGGVGADGEKTFMMMRGRDMRLRNRSLHRKTRSLSPPPLEWRDAQVPALNDEEGEKQRESDLPTEEAAISGSASSSRSSSSGGRNSRKWVFLKDLLYRSKSEGRASTKEKFWSFSPAKDKKSSTSSAISTASKSEEIACEKGKKQQQQRLAAGKPANGNVSKRRVPPSAHELHYTANRAQAEEMKKRTYLPYRQGLFGCLGFSSKGYGVLQGFTKTLNPVSST
uniref:Uncharacterized protein n=1 Tax=Kalanchoe fedtschenkoi TaxID=63787 RepID=A0A7N0TLN6_KALFE